LLIVTVGDGDDVGVDDVNNCDTSPSHLFIHLLLFKLLLHSDDWFSATPLA
jgi:hypothetical protein